VRNQLRGCIRYLHYSLRTEKSYVYWVTIFINFHGLRHPVQMGRVGIDAFPG